MKLPKPIKKIAIKIISFVLSVPFLKNMAKRFLPLESRLYQKLYHGYHNATVQGNTLPTPEYAAQHLAAFEHAMRTSSLDQLKIFQMLLSHDNVMSEGVYDENCY